MADVQKYVCWIHLLKLGLTVFVDTNGSLDLCEDIYSEFVEVTDKFMVDMKVLDEKNHNDLTGNGNLLVRKNIEFLGELGKLYEVRTVVVPRLLDNIKTVDEVSRLIGEINSKNKTDEDIIYKLIKYRQTGVRKEILDKELNGIKTPADQLMEELSEIARGNGVEKVGMIAYNNCR